MAKKESSTLSAARLAEYRDMLRKVALEAEAEGTLTIRDTKLWKAGYNPVNTGCGRQVYNSYSDDELLSVLRTAGEKYQRVPRKSDVHCFYVSYLKLRFGDWNTALEKSGYSVAETKDEPKTDKKHEKTDGWQDVAMFLIVGKGDVPDHIPTLSLVKLAKKDLKEVYGTRNSIIKAADAFRKRELESYPCPDSIGQEYAHILNKIKDKAVELGRTPLRAELDIEECAKLWKLCGSWKNVLKMAGLKPLEDPERAHVRYEFMIKTSSPDMLQESIKSRLSEGELSWLQTICDLAREKNRLPMKHELGMSEQMYDQLRRKLGAWPQLMRQLGLPARTQVKPELGSTKKQIYPDGQETA